LYHRTIFGKLADLGGVYAHQMSADIAGKHLGITDSTLGYTRHVAIDAVCDRRMYI
jgi:hypothetical protein